MLAAMNQYMPQIIAVYAKNSHFFSILRQLEKPCSRPVNILHTFLQNSLLSRLLHKNHTDTVPIMTRMATTHQILKLRREDRGIHICSTKKPPKRSNPPTTTTASRRSITRSSHPLSKTTVPRTLSYDAFLWSGSDGSAGAERRVMTPQRTNSPMRGNTKLEMFPILIPLKAVVRVMLSSIGRRS